MKAKEEMEINKIHNIDFLNNTLPDKSAQLIIADPPYFEIKGDFDFIWKSFDDYLKDVEKWAVECKRLLADNGTLFWYGDAKKIAYAQIIFDKHFNLINNLVWDKGSFMGLQESEGLRSFAPCTERILTCSRPNDLVVVPFAGSGTEVAMAAKENRNFIGFDIEKKYCDMGNKRASWYLRQKSLF